MAITHQRMIQAMTPLVQATTIQALVNQATTIQALVNQATTIQALVNKVTTVVTMQKLVAV